MAWGGDATRHCGVRGSCACGGVEEGNCGYMSCRVLRKRGRGGNSGEDAKTNEEQSSG